MNARNITVSGYVQGVGFRWYTMRVARALGLSGWVKNQRDGTVEIWAEGRDDLLDELVERLRKGPPGAVVRELNSIPAKASGKHAGFNVTY